MWAFLWGSRSEDLQCFGFVVRNLCVSIRAPLSFLIQLSLAKISFVSLPKALFGAAGPAGFDR